MPLSKKQIERFYFDAFASHLPTFPIGEILESEEPDFLIEAASQTIGVELTELHRAPPNGAIPQQASEAMRRRVITRAQVLYASAGLPPIRCAVHMQEQHIEKEQVEDLARAIAEIARRNIPNRNASMREEYDWTNRDYFPEAVIAVSVHRLDVITKNHFFCPGATWVVPLSIDDLKRTLASKEKKLSGLSQTMRQSVADNQY